MLVTSQSQKQVLLTHLQLRYNTGTMSTTPDEPESIFLELQCKTGTYQDYDDIVGEAATKVKIDQNLYEKYTKREQTPSVSENAVQEDLRKLRRMQVFMCAALAMTLLIAAATFVFVIMMKWSRNKDLNASKSTVQGKSQWTIYTLSLLEIYRKSRALHELSLKTVY